MEAKTLQCIAKISFFLVICGFEIQLISVLEGHNIFFLRTVNMTFHCLSGFLEIDDSQIFISFYRL